MKLQSSKNGSNFVCGKGTFLQIRSHIISKTVFDFKGVQEVEFLVAEGSSFSWSCTVVLGEKDSS